jgi:hypothetical protein
MRSREERKKMTSHVAYEVAALEITSDLFRRTKDRLVFEAFQIVERERGSFRAQIAAAKRVLRRHLGDGL